MRVCVIYIWLVYRILKAVSILQCSAIICVLLCLSVISNLI